MFRTNNNTMKTQKCQVGHNWKTFHSQAQVEPKSPGRTVDVSFYALCYYYYCHAIISLIPFVVEIFAPPLRLKMFYVKKLFFGRGGKGYFRDMWYLGVRPFSRELKILYFIFYNLILQLRRYRHVDICIPYVNIWVLPLSTDACETFIK